MFPLDSNPDPVDLARVEVLQSVTVSFGSTVLQSFKMIGAFSCSAVLSEACHDY